MQMMIAEVGHWRYLQPLFPLQIKWYNVGLGGYEGRKSDHNNCFSSFIFRSAHWCKCVLIDPVFPSHFC